MSNSDPTKPPREPAYDRYPDIPRSARGRGARLSAADLAKLHEVIEGVRTAGRELAAQGVTPREIAEIFELPEDAVRDLLSDATEVSPATMQALAGRRSRRA